MAKLRPAQVWSANCRLIIIQTLSSDCIRVRGEDETKMAKSVLIIDDERDLCEVISRVLKKDGFDVECAYNLGEASEKLLANPDIVILDNNLPDGTGLEYIRMYPLKFMKCFIILITADPNKELKVYADDIGITSFLTKPFSVENMKQIIKSA